jgi:Wzt-like putative exopolysaccharide export protein
VDVLLLDEVFAVGDEEFQRKCFGKIFEFKQRGGTIVFVSHDASAVERLCPRAVLLRDGRVAFDGPTREAVTQYHRLLAEARDPEERGAGLTEYGSGECRITEVALRGPGGEERLQFAPGEPLAVHVAIRTDPALEPPRLVWELRDEAGLVLAAGSAATDAIGWRPGDQEQRFRFDVDSLPLADGRFRLRFELSDRTGARLYHWLDDAARFVVYPTDGVTGLVRLEGRWAADDRAPATTD